MTISLHEFENKHQHNTQIGEQDEWIDPLSIGNIFYTTAFNELFS